MFWETYVALIVVIITPFVAYAYAMKPVSERIQRDLEEKGILTHHEDKLFSKRKHYFYSTKVSDLSQIMDRLQQENLDLPALPDRMRVPIFQMDMQQDYISFSFSSFSFTQKFAFRLETLGFYNGTYSYRFGSMTTKKLNKYVDPYFFNFLLTRVEKIMRQLDKDVSIEEKIS